VKLRGVTKATTTGLSALGRWTHARRGEFISLLDHRVRENRPGVATLIAGLSQPSSAPEGIRPGRAGRGRGIGFVFQDPP